MSAEDLYKDRQGISWHENNREISFNGDFYEVVKIEKGSKKAIVYIIKDKKEKELFNAFYSADKKRNNLLSSIVKLLFNLQSQKSSQPEFTQPFIATKGPTPYRALLIDPLHYFKTIKPPQIFC